MKPIEDLIRNCSFDHSLAEDFEAKVFTKIKRKKTVKKIGYSFTVFFVVGVILFLSFIFLQPDRTQDDPLRNKFATQFPQNPAKSVDIKEEIPVIEHVYFAPSDGRDSYAIEQVSYSEEDEDGI
jgi:hypothetical protein